MADRIDIIVSLKDRFSRGFGSIGKSLGAVRSRVTKLKNSIFSLKAAFLGLGASLVIRSIIKTKNEFVKYQKTLETLEGSIEGANKKWKEMLQFAEETPFKIAQVMDSYKMLKAFGLDPTIATMTILGDTAAALGGADVLGRISLVLGQIQAQGFMTAQDMNQLANAGINAAKVMKDSFGAARNEVARLKDQGITANQIIDALLKNMQYKFGGQMVLMNKELDGQWEMLLSIWERFTVSIMDSGVYEYLRVSLTLINDEIIKLREEGKLDEWAEKISDTVINLFEKMVIGSVSAYARLQFIVTKIKKSLTSIWDWYTGLPKWIQKAGIIVAFLGGTVAKVAFVIIADYTRRLENLKKKMEELHPTDQAGKVFKIFREDPKAPDEEDNAVERIKKFFEKLKKLREEGAEEAAKPAKPKEDLSAVFVPTVSEKAKEASLLTRLKATAQTTLVTLSHLYKDGEIELQKYFDRRREMVVKQYSEEIAIMQKVAEKEEDPSKKLAIEDKIFVRSQAHKKTLIELTREQADAEMELAQKKVEIDRAMADLRLRAESEKGGPERIGFDEELAEMENRHMDELKSFKDLLNDKLAAEMGYGDEASALRDIQGMQRLEKEKLLANQDRRIQETKLENARTISSGMSTIFSDLYELTGKKQKEFFYLSKAADIAQAIANVALGVTKALAQGGIMGPVMAGIVTATGAIQIAKITAQRLATGGPVLGRSPSTTSDNIDIKATAGEYMQPVKAVKYYGKEVMEGIRTLKFPKGMFSGFSLPKFSRPSYSLAAGGPVPSRPEEGDREPEINIINVTDPRDLDQYLASSGGQNAVLNVLSSKAETVKRLLR